MRVFHRLRDLEGTERSAVAIGNFDGCHLGHTSLVRHMVRAAKDLNLVPTVLTFYPHPVEILNPGKKLLRLTTTSEKLSLLEKLGVEIVLVAPFTLEVSSLSPAEFFEKYLQQTLHAASVHVGFNFRFGKERAGDTTVLSDLCQKVEISLHIEPPFLLDGEKVSSSRIREFIQAGDLVSANQLLGRLYTLEGQVTSGDRRGGQLGFPTANLRCPAEKLLPRNGVYVTQALWQKQMFSSVSNVGVRPTFHVNADTTRPVVEVHLLDFHSRIYEEFLELRFLERLRDEIRFSSKEALSAQIEKDVVLAKEIISKR